MTEIVYAELSLDANLNSFLDELKLLTPLLYDELCVTKDFPLAPDWDQYERLLKADMLRCVTCRAGDELIGYVVFIVHPHLHYKTCKTAFEDMHFIRKDHRKGRVGIRLFKYAEEMLKAIGVNRIIVHTKVHLDNSKLFEYLDYKNTDKLFTKVL
jgi:GNAT superfamily N-acetyltransferase